MSGRNRFLPAETQLCFWPKKSNQYNYEPNTYVTIAHRLWSYDFMAG